MTIRKLLALVLCACLLPVCASAAGEEVTLKIGDQVFSASPDATELDLGEMKLPDTEDRKSVV